MARNIFALSIVSSALAAKDAAAGSKPNILFVLQDDYGWNDVGFHNDQARPFTSSLTAIAEEGMILDRHYVYWYCSPTRRSFLSGRNPIHHGTKLSGASDDLDLRWTWISSKLASVGYTSYWYGKGHTGYLSTNHLPIAHNFSDHYGYLTGGENYQNAPRWRNDMPASDSSEYSTDAYGAAAVKVVETHDSATGPFFLYLPWQAVHSPYDLPVDTSLGACEESNSTIMQMICDADAWTGKIVQTLKDRGMWENTLMVYSADNGGVADGNNYPLRGEKSMDFDGGFRVNAFVAGGALPKEQRGTVNKALVHITDWYPTLCYLAGVDSSDDPPEPPLPYDPAHPEVDIWGENSFPGIDGINVWEALTANDAEFNAGRQELILTPSAMIQGKYKLVTGMSGGHGGGHGPHGALAGPPSPGGAGGSHTGWRLANGTWTEASEAQWGCNRAISNVTDPPTPCLFDIVEDPEERHNLAEAMPELLRSMQAALELAWAKNFTPRSPSMMLGPCNESCAAAHYGLGDGDRGVLFPLCGVPGCTDAGSDVLLV